MSIEKFIDQRKNLISESISKLAKAFAQESKETKEMLEIYYRYTRGKATIEEIKIADKQFRDLLKSLGIGVFALLPFAPITLPVVFKIAEKLGVDLVPSAFKKKIVEEIEGELEEDVEKSKKT